MSDLMIMIIGTLAFITADATILTYYKHLKNIRDLCKQGRLVEGACVEIREWSMHTSGGDNDHRDYFYACSYDVGDGIILKDAHSVLKWKSKFSLLKTEPVPKKGDRRKFWIYTGNDIPHFTFWNIPVIQKEVAYWTDDGEINNENNMLLNIIRTGLGALTAATIVMLVAIIRILVF